MIQKMLRLKMTTYNQKTKKYNLYDQYSAKLQALEMYCSDLQTKHDVLEQDFDT